MIDINSIKTNSVLFIRHADRDEIPQNEIGNNILLNEIGKSNALNLGMTLTHTPICKIYTSPVERCVQTAEFIKKGTEQNIEILKSNILGSPGALISNGKKTADLFRNEDGYVIYSRIINGEKINGFNSLEITFKKLQDFFKEIHSKKELTICISHDLLIMVYIFILQKKICKQENWLDFLDGISLTEKLLK